MHQKDDKTLKDLQKISEISQISASSKSEYHFWYTPKKLQGPYTGSSFKIKLILPKQFPQISPEIYFLDIPYHLNIDIKTGRFFAAFLSEDWCSFMTFQMIFAEIKALLQNPEQKSALCEQMKQQFLQNKKAYEDQINLWKKYHRKSFGHIDTSKSRKYSQISSICSYPDSIKEQEKKQEMSPFSAQNFHKNKLSSKSSSRQDEFLSSTLSRNVSSPVIIAGSLKLKKTQSNLSKAKSISKNQLSYFSPQTSLQCQNATKMQSPSRKYQNISKKLHILPYSASVQQESIFDFQIPQKQQNDTCKKQIDPKSGISRTNNVHYLKPKQSLQRKNTMQVRTLLKQKLRSSDPDRDTERINQRKQTLRNQERDSNFLINIPPLRKQKKTTQNTDEQKTMRRLKDSPNDCLPVAQVEQNPALQSSLKTIRLKQKLTVSQFNDPSIKDNLSKIITHTEALMNEIKCIESVLQSTENQYFRQILEKKLLASVQCLQKLETIAALLKKQIVNNLSDEVQSIM